MKKANGKPLFTPEEIEVKPYDTAEFLDSDEAIAGYLAISLDDPDPQIFYQALWDVLRAKGMANMAKKTGLAREALYRMCQRGKKPQFETILRITRAVGIPLGFSVPSRFKRKAHPPKRRHRREAVTV